MKKELVEQGDRFLVTKNMASQGWLYDAASVSGSFVCIVPAGTILIAEQTQTQGFRNFVCRPELYEQLKDLVVPKSKRGSDTRDYRLLCRSLDVGSILIPIDPSLADL
jgi:hypothetical protein